MKNALAAVVVALLLGQPVVASEFEVPFEMDKKYSAILVEVAVNGRPRTFVLDTGASRTVVSPGALGLPENELKVTRFRDRGPGVSGEAMAGTAGTLRLGKRVWYDRRVVVMDLKEVSRVYGRPIDGLLGQDLLTEFNRIVFDFKTGKALFGK